MCDCLLEGQREKQLWTFFES